MSSHAHSAATTDAEGPVASRTRTQARRRARDTDGDEQKQPAQSSSHGSPAMRLYRHALESIFAMLDLEDLSRALAVCREWSAAARSMRPIDARIQRDEFELRLEGETMRLLPPIDALVACPLLRHVAAIEIKDKKGHAPTAVSIESLALLSQHALNLTSLWCRLTRTQPFEPMVFPAQLTALRLEFADEPSAAEINNVLTSLAALPVLQRLTLAFRRTIDDDVDFRLLAAPPSLIDVSMESFAGSLALSEEQLTQCRTSLGHLQRLDVGWLDSNRQTLLLQPPVTARWRIIGPVMVREATGELLLALPTLTKLDLWFLAGVPHVDFLSSLPLLTSVQLRNADAVPVESMLRSLMHCTGITELDMDCHFKSALVSTVLSALTKLRKLRLQGGWCTLQCFASGPVTQTLEELELWGQETLPLSELPHLFALKRLRSLVFWRCFEFPLDAATIESFSPPCALLPLLTLFKTYWEDEDEELEDQTVKRTGPSFDWMQKRLTQ